MSYINIQGCNAEVGSTQVNNVNYTTGIVYSILRIENLLSEAYGFQVHTPEEIDRLCLRALQCPNSMLVKNRLKEVKDKLLPKSIAWIFQNSIFKKWLNGEDVCLLWIKGGPGKGKTMMSIGIVEDLSQSRRDSSVVISFFCQNANYELNTIESIIKGLIWQLVDQEPALKISLRRRWDTTNGRFEEDMTSWRTLWNIFLEMLEKCKDQKAVYIIVDGLDECRSDGMAEFLKVIVRNGLDHPAKIKWMLTSRPLLNSAERELLTGNDQLQVSLELNSVYVSEAVKTYIASKVNELDRRQEYGAVIKQELEDRLTEKAEGTFLWVSLACKRLESVCREEVLATIQNLPPGLHAFYDRMFSQLTTEKDAPHDMKRYTRLLKVMILVYRPLKLEEVKSVTGLTDQGDDAIRALIDRCASFIKMQGNDIQFVHQSGRDYFSEENGQSILDSYEPFGHDDIARSCLSHLSEILKPNILGLKRPDSTKESIKSLKDDMKKVPLNSVDYAATFWAQHLENATRSTILQSGLIREKGAVCEFIRTKFLEWLECLSLLDKLPRAIEALKALARVTTDNQLALTLANDALRILLRHYHTMENWPLQIYSSAVIFSPESSVIRSKNMKRVPGWFRRISPTERTWTTWIQAMSGHSNIVSAVSFSPGGKNILTSSGDTTIKLWDAKTGNLQKTITGHSSWVGAAVFSPDGRMIVSGSVDKTVRLWDIKTGDMLKILSGHSDSVRTVVFSPDGEQIASGSNDNTIKIWEKTTGNLQNTLTGHSGWVRALAFSPDGKQIASSSSDGRIKLWDTKTGDLQNTLTATYRMVDDLAFSPDGTKIIFASYEFIDLYDIMTGNLHRGFASHSDRVYTLAFSPGGKQIVSGSADRTIKIWDAMTGALQSTLAGHFGGVRAVAFSPDGKQIVSGSEDMTARLWDVWDTIQYDCQETISGHSLRVYDVAFSPDGNQIASGSRDNTIKLWNTITGDLQETLKSHSSTVCTVAFSPNGKQIASGSYDSSVKLWDTTGKLQKTLASSYGWARAVAFSPNGKQIASISAYSFIKLWDTATGDLLKIMEDPSSWVYSLAFSPDGNQIASGSSSIRIWDVTTGDCKKILTGRAGWSHVFAFSPDGKQIAAGTNSTPITSGRDKGNITTVLDHHQFFTGSQYYAVELWDIDKSMKASKYLGNSLGSRLTFRSCQEIEVPDLIRTIRFSEDGRYLKTNSGTIDLQVPFSSEMRSFQDLYVRDQWICYGDISLLRMPSNFIPTCEDVRGDLLTIGFENGRVLSFNIDRSMVQSIFM
ncbi:G-protein beta WD- 40 repeats containing protein [Penicillium angulare]|uniref:G-protein beta WD- 40 repeats containing protein n=1 Tax=Penicillium angulare TaxID=116970 RepID=A0A9W9EVA9_9EURO|nr:G-protein beta WD- 40 repeats containing protein [Penicillium angulare]